MSAGHIDVKIMGRDYRVACTPDDEAQLLEVVALVDAKMTDIASKTRNAIPERVAVMAAMSIAHDLLAKPAEGDTGHDNTQSLSDTPNEPSAETLARLSVLNLRIDQALQEAAQEPV
jgi:cell division protein ZapA